MPQKDIIRVLIIDDHPIFRKTMQMVLKNIHGVLVAGEADDGQTALDKVQELNPDIVIMDVNLPGIDGIEATRRIKRSNHGISIIALSNYTDDYHKREMIKAGASDYLIKTASLNELEQTILRSLSTQHSANTRR